jgi:hypothetical protein
MLTDSEIAEAQYQALLKVWKNTKRSILNEIIDSQQIFYTMMDDTYLKPWYIPEHIWHDIPIEVRNLFLIKEFDPSDDDIVLGLSVFSAVAGRLVWNLIKNFSEDISISRKYSEQITPEQILFNFWVPTERQVSLKLD